MKCLVVVLLFVLIVFLGISESLAVEKLIVLTFDDGPRPYVLKNLLPLLLQYSAPATFFMIGSEILPNYELIKEMSKNGYEIENHSWGHENLVKLLKEKGDIAVNSNLEKTNDLILRATGQRPKFFRPPYWEINGDVEKIAKNLNLVPMKLDNPDLNTIDYDDFSKRRSAEVLVGRVKKIIDQREKQNLYQHVLTFHELPLTVEALKILIPYFQDKGYKFIRLDQWRKKNAL